MKSECLWISLEYILFKNTMILEVDLIAFLCGRYKNLTSRIFVYKSSPLSTLPLSDSSIYMNYIIYKGICVWGRCEKEEKRKFIIKFVLQLNAQWIHLTCVFSKVNWGEMDSKVEGRVCKYFLTMKSIKFKFFDLFHTITPPGPPLWFSLIIFVFSWIVALTSNI